MKFYKFILFIGIAAFLSCKKDKAVNYTVEKTVRTDTSNNSGNFLATKGSLFISVGDTIYSFNAAKDSIAFINVNIDSNKYFGITAINKQHTMSFGISSPGFAAPQLVNNIAGGNCFSAKKTAGNTLYRKAGARENLTRSPLINTCKTA
ncbi:hypothetical protein [Mucilaginibacter antarcticus]|uniref:hypothetical protein n=1 Tax=Mucilaginibacter antarcticus TaxID=1855725 RepID=UPI00363D08F7